MVLNLLVDCAHCPPTDLSMTSMNTAPHSPLSPSIRLSTLLPWSGTLTRFVWQAVFGAKSSALLQMELVSDPCFSSIYLFSSLHITVYFAQQWWQAFLIEVLMLPH